MLKHILVKLKYRQLIMHWNIILGIFLVLSACGDLVEESDTGACDSAIDARNYDKAISVCTSRKDKASAYMGKAGYDIINMLKSSGSSATAYTAPSGVSLGTDDVAGASILNILQRSEPVIPDDDARATAIANSKTNLDSASALLQPYLNDNSQPLSTDEILLNTFAISFAMQLHQLVSFDKKTTSAKVYPVDGDNATADGLVCTEVTNANLAGDKLIAMDGHLWSTEMNGMQCTRIKDAIQGQDNASYKAFAYDNLSAWKLSGGLLPDMFREGVCEPVVSLETYLTDLSANIAKFSTSGDNTKAITNAQTSSNILMKAIGCKE
jgi:hypothetical protein